MTGGSKYILPKKAKGPDDSHQDHDADRASPNPLAKKHTTQSSENKKNVTKLVFAPYIMTQPEQTLEDNRVTQLIDQGYECATVVDETKSRS